MMFADLKPRLGEPEVQRVLSLSMGDPTPEKIARVVERCRNSADRKLCGMIDGAEILAVAEYYLRDDGALYIANIAVTEARRGQGIGRALIAALRDQYGLPIALETDDDAIGFYLKCGFAAEGFMHEAYGVRRWRCRLR